jgi:hypothetical protein
MYACVRADCARPALASWWLLCAGCSEPLLALTSDVAGDSVVEQQMAAGWDALGWAERIAPSNWGNAAEADPWVVTVRCLAVASVVTGRSSGCAHTVSPVTVLPVVAVARVPGVLRCPPCAEPVVGEASEGGRCDRCAAVPVTASDRTAVLTGASLIVVAQLCGACRREVVPLLAGVETMPSSEP